ncbi:MAG: nucleotidyltransferase domain-containing protein, partial [Niabella sp.]|nr:nucleotidyltransferase domain-containing protein [Niabella sp.]
LNLPVLFELLQFIFYAVESGSRAWGFASQDSDWDVRFIYVHQYDWYLSIQDHKDNMELMLPGDIDMAGWELRKALLLFRKSNPPLLEWLRSPMVYLEKYTTAEWLRKSTSEYFNPKSCLYHYFHMAKGNYEAYFKENIVRLKKYLYVLRPILACSWIQRTMQMAPMEFDILVEREISNPILKKEIEKLLIRKKNGEELDRGNRINIIDDFIEEKLLHFENYLSNFDAGKAPAFEELNNIFRSTLKEVWN